MKALNSQQEITLATITERLYFIMKENPSINANEAIELAFTQEQYFLSEMINQKTERSKKGLQQINKNVYGLIHLIK